MSVLTNLNTVQKIAVRSKRERERERARQEETESMCMASYLYASDNLCFTCQ